MLGSLLGILLVLGFLGLMIYLFSAGAATRALNQQERNELNQLRALVEAPLELAHRRPREADQVLVVGADPGPQTRRLRDLTGAE